MRRTTLLLALALAVALGSCAVGAEDEHNAIDPDSVPFSLLERDAPSLVPLPTAEITERVQLWFVKEERLTAQERAFDAPASLTRVVNSLAEPPADVDGIRTALGGPDFVASVKLEGGVVTVDLTAAVSTLGGNDQLLAVAQLVCTLTARPGVGQVTFTLAGAPIDVPRADGSVTSEPLSRDDYAALIA